MGKNKHRSLMRVKYVLLNEIRSYVTKTITVITETSKVLGLKKLLYVMYFYM